MIYDKENVKQLLPALLKAHKKIEAAKKDATNTFFNGSKYATLQSVVDAIKEPLIENGLYLIHTTTVSDVLTTTLFHESGECVFTTTQLRMSKNDMQQLGSAITYAKRQNITSLLNLPTEDDDANNASGNQAQNSIKTNANKPPLN